jgi:hypothetical protein
MGIGKCFSLLHAGCWVPRVPASLNPWNWNPVAAGCLLGPSGHGEP